MEKKYIIPDRANSHNYMLDTSAYNYIAQEEEILRIVKMSLAMGFRYYSTKIQDLEMSGCGAKIYGQDGLPHMTFIMPSEKIQMFRKIEIELNVGLVPEVAILMHNHFRADGTNRFINPNSIEGKLFDEIESKNNPNSNSPFAYTHDALIAEAAIHYGCILVTNDKKLRKTVESHFQGCAISADELLEIIKRCQTNKICVRAN